MNKFYYIFLVLFIGGMFLANTGSASICENKETVVLFGNGIKTIEEKAYDSRDLLKKRLKMALSPEEYDLLDFKLAYNATHGLPLDLLESTLQILTGNTSRFWRFFWGLAPAPDWFTDNIILLSVALDNSALVTSDSLRDHVSTYKTKIAEGKKIILVAHSQGNLFGNQAYRLLNSREKLSFGMVSVANVDNNVLGGGAPYTTLVDDKVVSALIAAQIALPTKPMPPNTENLEASEDSLGHYFIQSYMMEGSISDIQVIDDIIAVLDSLATPPPHVEAGVINVSLTWGYEPDMDLHVYEPNGTHVYWENRYGYSGKLDRDDRSSRGPEHYNVPSCETLEWGVYHIGLDYFKGYGPEVATVVVEAGTLTRTFTVPMPSELYGDPDHPEIIAHVSVRNGDNGGFEFNIYPN